MRELSLKPAGQPVDAAPRVLVAVADDLLGLGLARLLDAAGIEVVARIGSPAAAGQFAADLEVDVALLELRRPRVGAVAVARLLESARTTRVLALSASPDEKEAVRVLAAGASGYLPMSADASVLVSSVRALHAGEVIMPREIAEGVLAPLRATPADPSAEELAAEPLTARELEVLSRVARGFANDEIARELVVTASTVKNHMARIAAKMGARNRTHAAVLAVQRRYF